MLGILTVLTLLPVVASLPVYLVGRSSARASKTATIGVGVLSLALAVWVYLQYGFGNSGFRFVEEADWVPSFGLRYVLAVDGVSLPLLIIAALLSLLAAAGSWDLITHHIPEYNALFLVFMTGIIGVFTSLNLILFYVFWELVLIPMFFFIGVWGGPNRRYAAIKFLLFTFTGSVVMLFGFIVLFAGTGSFDYLTIADVIQRGQLSSIFSLLALVTTFLGFAVKLPMVPFHTWLPDAHVEAPAPISVLLAGLLLKMGGYGFIRFNLQLFPGVEGLWPVFAVLGLVTMVYGASVAMIQQDLKKLIALTSINHMGFVLLGTFTLDPIGVSGSVFQMFNHANAIGLLFLMSGYIHEHAGTRQIDGLPGFRSVMPGTAPLLVMGSMAAMAVPGFASFISEYWVIQAAIGTHYLFAISIAAPAITVGYFLWVLRRTVMMPQPPDAKAHDAPFHARFTLAIFLVPLLVFGIYPGPLLNDIIVPTVNGILGV